MLKPLLHSVAQSKTSLFHYKPMIVHMRWKIFFRMFSELEIAQGSQKKFWFQNSSMLKPLLRIVAQSKTSFFHYKPIKMQMRWKKIFRMFSEEGFVQGSQK